MKNTFSYAMLGICLFLSVSCMGQKIKGQGPMVTVDLNLDKFDGISLSLSADVIITQGSPQKVTIKGQQNIIDNIPLTVSNGNWDIRFKKKTWNYDRLTIHITMEDLESVAISGSGNIETTNQFKTNGDFSLSISGSGDADVDIIADDIGCSISGSGKAYLKGNTGGLAISISGSGDVKAYGLNATDCKVSTAGSGNSEVNVSGSLKASIVGSGDVHYKGDPKVNASVLGSGKVHESH